MGKLPGKLRKFRLICHAVFAKFCKNAYGGNCER